MQSLGVSQVQHPKSCGFLFSVGVVGNFDVTDSDHTSVAKGFPQQVNNEVR